MNRSSRFCVLLLATVAAGGTSWAQSAADLASVDAFYAAWFGPGQQDPDTYASFYAPDGYILPPGSPPAQGREAIADWQRQSRAAATFTVIPEAIPVDEVRFPTSDWVVYRSTLRGQRVPKAGGDPIPFDTKYFDLLHRSAGGDWKVAYRMWSDSR